ncbi:hypothetical protein RJT34_22605 [Clitoria ternatea]|uniref:Uncharacterized protein n=1 Tax=Clitoria ternatea TaxID=43366 RepID=A0AAN9FQH7_CLITE
MLGLQVQQKMMLLFVLFGVSQLFISKYLDFFSNGMTSLALTYKLSCSNLKRWKEGNYCSVSTRMRINRTRK